MHNLNSETKNFGAQVSKVLHLMINALYTNKDTCIRELISNASDACDKLRYLSQFDSSLSNQKSELSITVRIDKERNTLSMKDTGIGMDKEDLNNELGTIARSGTQHFLEKMTGDARQDSDLVGQFGVGFYSIFMIADTVEVKTRKAGQEQSYMWSSNGEDSYTITDSKEQYDEGTEVIAYLKFTESEYVDFDYIKNIIVKYSNNLAFPIFLEDAGQPSIAKNQINSSKALWALNKNDISSEQYTKFYQEVFYSSDEPWKVLHNKNEGSGVFTNLLFIPAEKTFDLFSSERKRRVKLYVKRVFVAEDGLDLIPYYLRFIRGIVDTDNI